MKALFCTRERWGEGLLLIVPWSELQSFMALRIFKLPSYECAYVQLCGACQWGSSDSIPEAALYCIILYYIITLSRFYTYFKHLTYIKHLVFLFGACHSSD